MNRPTGARPRPYPPLVEPAQGVRSLVVGHVAVLVGIGVVVVLFLVAPRSDVGLLGSRPQPAGAFGAVSGAVLVGVWVVGHLQALWRLCRPARAMLDPGARSSGARGLAWTVSFFVITAQLTFLTLVSSGPVPRPWLLALFVGLLLASFLLCHAHAAWLHRGIPARGELSFPGGWWRLAARQQAVAGGVNAALAIGGLGLVGLTVVLEGWRGPAAVVHVAAGLAMVALAVVMTSAAVVARRAFQVGVADLAVLDRSRAVTHRAGLVAVLAVVLVVVGVAVEYRTRFLGGVAPGLLIFQLWLLVLGYANLVRIRVGDVGQQRARLGLGARSAGARH